MQLRISLTISQILLVNLSLKGQKVFLKGHCPSLPPLKSTYASSGGYVLGVEQLIIDQYIQDPEFKKIVSTRYHGYIFLVIILLHLLCSHRLSLCYTATVILMCSWKTISVHVLYTHN